MPLSLPTPPIPPVGPHDPRAYLAAEQAWVAQTIAAYLAEDDPTGHRATVAELHEYHADLAHRLATLRR